MPDAQTTCTHMLFHLPGTSLICSEPCFVDISRTRTWHEHWNLSKTVIWSRTQTGHKGERCRSSQLCCYSWWHATVLFYCFYTPFSVLARSPVSAPPDVVLLCSIVTTLLLFYCFYYVIYTIIENGQLIWYILSMTVKTQTAQLMFLTSEAAGGVAPPLAGCSITCSTTTWLASVIIKLLASLLHHRTYCIPTTYLYFSGHTHKYKLLYQKFRRETPVHSR